MTEENNEVAGATEEVQEQAQAAEVKESPQDKNWKEVNQVLKLQKQQIQELEMRLTHKEQPAPIPEKDEFADLDQDDYMTVGKARAMAEKMAEKKAEIAARKIVAEYAQQQTVQSDETRCRGKYDDYDYVLENFALPAIKNDPALAHKIQSSRNPAETAYKLGKLSDAYEESIAKQGTNPKAEKILKNASRPVSSNAASSSLKVQADQFANMSHADVWAQSQKYARG